MKPLIFISYLALFLSFSNNFISAQNKLETPYGNNKAVGKHIPINGTKLYYEEYGKGEPLLIIHSCGTDISAMEYQIDHFKKTYRVIAADSRGQGKSELNTKSLSYNLMAEDLEKLVQHLKLDSISILGWSDGGIVSLKLGIRNKIKIKKIVAMGANLRPDTTAINNWAYQQIREMRAEKLNLIKKGDTSKNWKKELLLDELLITQPNITHTDLKKITAPVLIMIGDRDIIRNEHAMEIHNTIPKSQLCIMPGTDHGAPRNNTVFFNGIAEKFLSEKFNY